MQRRLCCLILNLILSTSCSTTFMFLYSFAFDHSPKHFIMCSKIMVLPLDFGCLPHIILILSTAWSAAFYILVLICIQPEKDRPIFLAAICNVQQNFGSATGVDCRLILLHIILILSPPPTHTIKETFMF